MMNVRSRPVTAVAAALFAGTIALFDAAAQTSTPLSVNEKLYADLFKMAPDKRAQAIVAGAKKEGRVELLNAQYGPDWRAAEMKWAERYPDVIKASNGLSSSTIAERLVAEESAGKHMTDAGYLSSVDVALVVARGFAARYETPMTDRILDKYRGFLGQYPNKDWTPASMTTHGMAYNFKLLSDDKAPKAWFDLCKPEFKGQVSYDPIELRLLIAWYTMLGEAKARELIQCIGANDPILGPAHGARFQMLEAGDHPVSGDVLLHYVQKARSTYPAKTTTKEVFTAPLLADAFGSVINKNAPHPYAAALFVDWKLSEDNQHHLTTLFYDPLTKPATFTPGDAEIVLFGPVDKAIGDRLLGYWNQYVTKKDARGTK